MTLDLAVTPANTNAGRKLRAVELGEPPPGFREPDPYVLNADVWSRFRSLYQERYGYLPAMNAKNAGDFGERLASLAQKLKVDPMVLLEQGFDAWCRHPPKEGLGLDFPYANFVMRFERLVMSPTGKPSVLSAKDHLERQISDALTKGDHAGYARLNERYRQLYLGGAHARPAG
jgi:hypothetical protein